MEKECKDCLEVFDISEFYPRPQKGRGTLKVETRCKKCYSNKQREYRRNNKNKYRSSVLKTLYGITLETYNEMYTKQRGLCEICGKHKDVLCVDHCHSTGNVRGLLCKVCNQALGLFKEDPVVIRKGAEYIEKSCV